MVLLEWTVYGFSGENKKGLSASKIKTLLADRSFWHSWVKDIEPLQRLLAESIKWVCMKKEPVLGNEVVNERLTAALDTCFLDGRWQPLSFPSCHNKVVKSH